MKDEKHNRHRARFWGLLLIIVGSLFFFESIEFLDIGDFISTFWPLILICIGLWIIFKPKERGQRNGEGAHHFHAGDKEGKSDSERVAMSNVFGDVNVAIHSKSFQGGNISTVFGDVVVDLSEIDITSGDQDLTLHNAFGDIKVQPPKNVAFAIKGNCVAGDITFPGNKQSGLFPKLDYKSEGFDQAPKRLWIYASHVFGDIRA